MKRYKELMMYVIFGVATTAVNWVVYTICISLSVDMTLSNAIAWVISVLFAFITNKIFVFESKETQPLKVLREGLSFFGSRIATGLLEIIFPSLLFTLGLNQSFFGIKGLWAKAVVSVLVIILNYIFSKWLVFREKNSKKPKEET